MARAESARAVGNVWAKTLGSYRKDLSQKDLLVVEGITLPMDIANHIKDLEAKTHSGKRGAFADRIHAATGRLTQFSNVISAVTSSNTEASLIWGSLKLLLTIVHQSFEEYEKICKSILAVSLAFPTIELVTETFSHSDLVCGPAADFYACVLRFWSKALKFYKRRRIFNIFRVWHDFDSEFGDLDLDMKRYGKIIGKAATAVHMQESRTARLEQKAISQELLDAKRSIMTSNHHRDIVKWLAPFNHEAGYFEDDLRSALDSRHPDTCKWILNRPEFDTWTNSGPNNALTRMLWLTGVPGAGKTVLSSFVIERCLKVSTKKPSHPVLYFFFKLTDSDKNSVLAVIRSLVYQLYLLYPANLCSDIVSLRDESGKEYALSDQRLWDLFVKHAMDLENLTIVLDALDECEDVKLLLRRMKSFSERCNAKVLVVSRREEIITLALEEYPCVEIEPGDIDADIHHYVTAEVKKIPRFQGKSIQQRMIGALASGHGGMFLWAYLMLKELKELGTVRQVDDALKTLPTGLQEMHETIITRLNSTLHQAHRELATKILTWVVCAVRPLRLAELQEILRFEIRQGKTTDQLQADDDNDDLLYSEKDIELACGALVISRNGTLQLIHLSTKEILMRRPPNMYSDDSRLAFYVDSQRENPQMATLCVSYLSLHLNGIDSVSRPNLETVSRLRFSKESFDSSELVTKSPFIDYASASWQAHLVDGKVGFEIERIMRRLQALLTIDLTVLWIEVCVLLHQDIIWTLERCCKEIMLWADNAMIPAESSCHQAIRFLWTWSNAVVLIINEYGGVIEERPYEIHYLDLEAVLLDKNASGPATLPLSFARKQEPAIREQISVVRALDELRSEVKVEPRRQLHHNLRDPRRNAKLGFILYDSTREVYFSAESRVANATEVIQVQDRASGRRLQPVQTVSGVDSKTSPPLLEFMNVQAAIMSPDRTYLAILYGSFMGDFVTSIWCIERHLDFLNIRDTRPWARRLHYLGSKNPSFCDSALPLTVGLDGFFYSPSGKIHPERGLHKRIPDSLITKRDRRRPPTRKTELAFAGNGQTMFRLDLSAGTVEKISWLEDMITESLHSGIPGKSRPGDRPYLKAVSLTARFVVYESSQKDRCKAALYLLDTVLDTRRCLEQLQIEHEWQMWRMGFHFFKDEKFLLSIGRVPISHTRFIRWAINDSNLVPQEESRLYFPYWCMGNVCVAEDKSMIILVDDDRILHELDLERLDLKVTTLATSMSSATQNQLYYHRGHRVSNDGLRLVAFYIQCPTSNETPTCDRNNEQSMPQGIRKTRIKLKFVDLSGTGNQIRTFDLEYPDPYSSASHDHVVIFSPDLSLLQAGLHIFDLLAPDHLSFPDSPLSNPCSTEDRVSFSACNGYLLIIEDEDTAAQGRKERLRLFRICRPSGRVEKIVIANLEGLVLDKLHVNFHPILPLLMLTCYTYPETDTQGAIDVMEVDLEALEAFPIALPKFDIDKVELTQDYTHALFSHCGSFCYLTSNILGGQYLSSVFLSKRQVGIQIPAVWGFLISYNGRFYHLSNLGEAAMIQLQRSITRPQNPEILSIRRKPEYSVVANITVIPAHLIPARVCLLVGESGNDFVRILFVLKEGPPQIKHLRVTMNQILAELEEAARDVKPQIEKRLLEEEEKEKTWSEELQEESLDTESEESQNERVEN